MMTFENIYKSLHQAGLKERILDTSVSLCRRGGLSRQRIFAVLCMLQLPALITEFEREGIFDRDLPFVFTTDAVYRETTKHSKRVLEPIMTFESQLWTPMYLELFKNYQYRVSAPIFKFSWTSGEKFLHFALKQPLLLPFLYTEDTELFREFGTTMDRENRLFSVRRMKIHRAHFNASPNKKIKEDVYFAIQELNTVHGSNKTHGENEERALRRLNEQGHSHLLRLLATFTHESRLYLIFPWADGNLKDLWMTTRLQSLPGDRHDLKAIRWMSAQILGITKALKIMLNYTINKENTKGLGTDERKRPNSQHGRLKHENILWFQGIGESGPAGILKIADLRVAHFHSNSSRIYPRDDLDFTYDAPEYKFGLTETSQCDIWSMGCILLQMIVWYLRGWKGVDDFSVARCADSKGRLIDSDSFFGIEAGSARMVAIVKASVREMFVVLKEDTAACSDYILDLLEYIESHLLRVDSTTRDNIDAIVQKFEKMDIDCRKSEDYCIARANYGRRTEPSLSEIIEVAESVRHSLFEPKKTNSGPENADFQSIPEMTQSSAIKAESSSNSRSRADPPESVTSWNLTDMQGGKPLETIGPAISGQHDNNSSLEEDGNSDVDTTYSTRSVADNREDDYIAAFTGQLRQDVRRASGIASLSSIPSAYLNELVRAFTWKLHEESSNPFQWGVSVALHRSRQMIVEEITGSTEVLQMSEDGQSSASEDYGLDEHNVRKPFTKDTEDVADWVGKTVEPNDADSSLCGHIDYGPEGEERESLESSTENYLPRLADFRSLIEPSLSYRWLISKINQYERLVIGDGDAIYEISSELQNKLRAHGSLRKMSHRRPQASVEMEFILDWHPRCLREWSPKLEDNRSVSMATALSLTGSWHEAQAMTITEYVSQTWPVTGDAVMKLLEKLCMLGSTQDRAYHEASASSPRLTAHAISPDSCVVSVRSGLQYVSEIAEQLAWLTATLQSSSHRSLMISRRPRIANLVVRASSTDPVPGKLTGRCEFAYDVDLRTETKDEHGSCWVSLFENAVLVTGYPTRRRVQTQTGLEMSLGAMSYLIRSNEIVRWGERIIMKGFGMLLIATMVSSSVTLWHLLTNEATQDRVSYFDSRIDELDLSMCNVQSLHKLETSRHFVGWCGDAEELCGHKRGKQNIAVSQLDHAPPSIAVDRLYLEGGMHIIGGVQFRINQKHDPTQLMRDVDYPSLLKWVAVQPMVFFDSLERRAWLVDGASGLLHLVRMSIYRDEHDEDSTYDWRFDSSLLNDNWTNCTMRQSALNTLKSNHNLDMNMYVKKVENVNGQRIELFATFRERVSKLLHALEILIENQARIAMQGDVRTLQTRDRRKFVTGYDVLDVIEPLEPVSMRIAHFETWGDGWMDLLPSINASVFFGEGFGELIQAASRSSMCPHWQSVPSGKDYMCASLSTLKMLHEKRLRRAGSTAIAGELTNKLTWMSTCHPFKTCPCLSRPTINEGEHIDPRQYLVSSKRNWKSSLLPKGSSAIDFGALDNSGAVIFANLGLLGRKIDDMRLDKNSGLAASQALHGTSSQLSAGISATASDSTQTTGTADATSIDTAPTPATTTSGTSADQNTSPGLLQSQITSNTSSASNYNKESRRKKIMNILRRK
ncbi:hypothetical protein BKA63DRAFT_517433 [Paraphoma chrysanthemicola]|nr:hypothetical protein BKA63DRAFT_517433 [Paraphoma chrysanthemicola]